MLTCVYSRRHTLACNCFVLCVCVIVYVCTCVCMRVYVRVYMCVCEFVCVFMCACCVFARVAHMLTCLCVAPKCYLRRSVLEGALWEAIPANESFRRLMKTSRTLPSSLDNRLAPIVLQRPREEQNGPASRPSCASSERDDGEKEFSA